jgi:hypothetical protein
MHELDGVTLCCVDTTNHWLALRALDLSRRGVQFARLLLLTDVLPSGLRAPEGIEIVPVTAIASRAAYSEFIVKSLLLYVPTPHVLLVQWDGYVANPGAWDHAFLDYDYIGAPWSWYDDEMRVGNGGFSLRSRRLLEALQDGRITVGATEDETICRRYRPLLERDYGIRFADEATAERFAFEGAYPIDWRTFGFHGLFNFCMVMPQGELAALAPAFSDAIAHSPQLADLLRNCVSLRQWVAAAAIARRILAAQPWNEEARGVLAQAQSHGAQVSAVRRNDSCPCGSGKRYKHCHGAPNAGKEG